MGRRKTRIHLPDRSGERLEVLTGVRSRRDLHLWDGWKRAKIKRDRGKRGKRKKGVKGLGSLFLDPRGRETDSGVSERRVHRSPPQEEEL